MYSVCQSVAAAPLTVVYEYGARPGLLCLIRSRKNARHWGLELRAAIRQLRSPTHRTTVPPYPPQRCNPRTLSTNFVEALI